jgi:hypothetical protein
MIQKFSVFIVMLLLGVSCTSTVNNNNSGEANADSVKTTKSENALPDISGYYRLPETGCNLALTITKENDGFKYYFKGEHLDLEGIALLSQEDSIYYITFDGPIGNTPPKTVSAQFKENTITIENYGNAMNEYNYFPDCSEKYLEFSKN